MCGNLRKVTVELPIRMLSSRIRIVLVMLRQSSKAQTLVTPTFLHSGYKETLLSHDQGGNQADTSRPMEQLHNNLDAKRNP